MAGITLNPMITTTGGGLFNIQSDGYVQGDAQDDPAVRFALAGGILDINANPLYGGIPISEIINESNLGNDIKWATTLANSNGIAVFNQAYQGIITPQSEAPLYQAGMSVAFYRFGSGARIPLRLNPALVTLDGEFINQVVSWDFTNLYITTYDGTNVFPVKLLDVSLSGNLTVSYSNGQANWLTSEYVVLAQI